MTSSGSIAPLPQVLGFVARRLGAESVGLVFAARTPSSDIAGLPGLVVERLGEADARALLEAALTAPLDSRVRDQILAETRVAATVVTCLAIVVSFLWMPYYPTGSIVLIALDVVVIWGVATWNTSDGRA